jgi:hypothetical protein
MSDIGSNNDNMWTIRDHKDPGVAHKYTITIARRGG